MKSAVATGLQIRVQEFDSPTRLQNLPDQLPGLAAPAAEPPGRRAQPVAPRSQPAIILQIAKPGRLSEVTAGAVAAKPFKIARGMPADRRHSGRNHLRGRFAALGRRQRRNEGLMRRARLFRHHPRDFLMIGVPQPHHPGHAHHHDQMRIKADPRRLKGQFERSIGVEHTVTFFHMAQSLRLNR